MSETELLVICNGCGNAGNCKVRGNYTQEFHNENESAYWSRTWYMLECPVCNCIILHMNSIDAYSGVTEINSQTLYPMRDVWPGISYDVIPKSVRKEYEEALKVQKISSNACATLARRTLEAILADQNASGKTLAEQINNLLTSVRIPPLLAEVAHLGRQIGNMGAHFDKRDTTMSDVVVMLEFLKVIIEYLYIIPDKVESVKAHLAGKPYKGVPFF